MKYNFKTCKIFSIIHFTLLAISLVGQKDTKIKAIIGPSVTNVQHIHNGEKDFFISPERPFYSIQYHLGINLEQNIFSKENLRLRYGIGYDKRASANTAFNKYEEEGYGFLSLPIVLFYKPIVHHEIRFEAGGSFLYPIHATGARNYVTVFKNYEIDITLGIEFHIWKNISIGSRVMQPLRIMNDTGNLVNSNPNIPQDVNKYKTHAFQFSFIYNFDLK